MANCPPRPTERQSARATASLEGRRSRRNRGREARNAAGAPRPSGYEPLSLLSRLIPPRPAWVCLFRCCAGFSPCPVRLDTALFALIEVRAVSPWYHEPARGPACNSSTWCASCLDGTPVFVYLASKQPRPRKRARAGLPVMVASEAGHVVLRDCVAVAIGRGRRAGRSRVDRRQPASLRTRGRRGVGRKASA